MEEKRVSLWLLRTLGIQALPSVRRGPPAVSRFLEIAVFLGESSVAGRWSALIPVRL